MTTLVINHGAAKAPAAQASGKPGPAAPLVTPQVSVDGIVISSKAIAAEVQNFPSRNPGEGWLAAARALVIRELLLQEARRLNIVAEPKADVDGREETVDDALVRGLIEREVRVPVADEATSHRFYENNRRRFTSAALYEADHILIGARRDDDASYAAARERATSIAAVLATEPDQFAELARAWSACPSATLGGSLGQIAPGDTTEEFEAALVSLAPGEISGPVETRYGVHVIRLNRRIEGNTLPFEAVRERIEAYLDDHVRRQATAQYIALLVGRADIRGISLEGANSPLVQ
ncbi:PpiC-type peptidyl-prolyl cis-trans isomerase [Hyphomicrobium denitrificans ATCC 51888]|uniref:Parvulin-like PPIase n=1 Tax=Hyphomicrobium denitrificans (strain ATCC 51888 / DSM 1869 / NCIMB 11706 / TK 0415) TaxID=582899 RepID=D8JUF4_HYPDA|nr:peptidylprolyl isomerase [Hyphomicrobium denitrificans]ADJ22744.1 PpiC-type peptidyl-prolyl cis-trans isomerase [Hyphomicrobium denitrificans ATCC 51888]